jgi:hypothetical protein
MNRDPEKTLLEGPRMSAIIGQSVAVGLLTWTTFVHVFRRQRFDDSIHLLPKFFAVSFTVIFSLAMLFKRDWPSGQHMNRSSLIISIASIISGVMVDSYKQEVLSDVKTKRAYKAEIELSKIDRSKPTYAQKDEILRIKKKRENVIKPKKNARKQRFPVGGDDNVTSSSSSVDKISHTPPTQQGSGISMINQERVPPQPLTLEELTLFNKQRSQLKLDKKTTFTFRKT